MTDLICEKAAKKAGLGKSDLLELAFIARDSAMKGAEILMKHYGQIKMVKNKGRAGDLVTNADLAAEEVVLNYLNKKTPAIEVLAEESGLTGNSNNLRWCVDPLDGTTNFTHGYPFFATSVGLTWNNEPVLGAISIPFIKENYWSAPHVGSFCNDEQISVSTCERLEDSLLVTGFAYDRHHRLDNNYAEFCWLTHRTRGVRRGGAAAVDLAFVAAGRLDGYWERGLAQWDLAAGIPLVELAGGLVSDYREGSFNIKNGRILASCPGINLELNEELEKVCPLDGHTFGAPEVKDVGC